MQTLSKQQVQVILQQAPKGTDPGKIVQALVDKGYKLEGFNDQPAPKAPGIFDVGVSKVKEGYNQAKDATNPLQLLEGGTKLAAGAFDTALAPVAKVISPVTDEIGKGITAVTKPITDNPAVQRFAMSEGGKVVSRVAEDVGNVADIAGTVAGIDKLPDIATNIKTKVDTTLENSAKKNLLKTADQKLQDAAQSIYPKLSAGEKATVALKDESAVGGSKSVPDLVNNPQTKPIIESVSNMPEDIQLKPSDTVAVKENKLGQGINRLHQETEGYLAKPEVRAQTTFKPQDYDAYMKEKVLNPISNEFGVDSIEFKEAQKAVETAKSQIATTDAHGVHTARQKFNAIFKDSNPRAFKKAKGSFGAALDPQTTAVIEAGQETSAALRDFTSDLLPENNPFKSRLKEESNLIRAKEEMRTRSADQLDKSGLQRTLDRNPKVKKVVNTAKNIATRATGYDIAGHILGD